MGVDTSGRKNRKPVNMMNASIDLDKDMGLSKEDHERIKELFYKDDMKLTDAIRKMRLEKVMRLMGNE